MIAGLDEVNAELEELMGIMHPALRKKAIRKALQYVRKVNKKRITTQKNADGTAYKARKQSINVGKHRVHYTNADGEEKSVVGRVSSCRRSNTLTITFDDGTAFHVDKSQVIKKKKVRANNKKMLTGFRKFLMLKMYGADKGVLGFKKPARRLARKHNFGDGDANLPARILMGLSEQDKLEAMRIMLAVLLESQQ